MGIFTNCSYGVTYDAQPVSILGRYGPTEIAYTGAEAINVSMSGWRVIGHGPHQMGSDPANSVPKLQDLLHHEDTTVSIYDRQDDTTPVMVVVGFRLTGYSTSVSARGIQEISVTGLGLRLTDESGDQGEPGAVDLP